MLGQATFNTSKSSSKILNSIESSIKNDINKAVSDIAKEFNIKDFYSAHVLDYCEGYYTPTPVQNLTTSVSENVTHCSNQTAMFHFDPASVIQSELKPGVNLTDLKWPSAIQDAIRAIELASKVMFVVYCIGASAVGIALLGAILGLYTSGRLSAVVNGMVATVRHLPPDLFMFSLTLTFPACVLFIAPCFRHRDGYHQQRLQSHQ